VSYIPQSERDRAAMLQALGIESVGELFRQIPPALRETATPVVPGPVSEPELLRRMHALADRNASLADVVCFAGGGVYDRFIPTIVLDVVRRPEFATGYTPYQPEASQGILQAMFEYQTMVCELTGMDVANASLYDGASAMGEAVLMAASVTGRRRALLSRALSPAARRVARTYCSGAGVEIVEVSYVGETGETDLGALQALLSEDVCCVALQEPNYFGVIEDMAAAAQAAHSAGALFVAAVEPVSLALLDPPGRYGADIVVGEGQPLGMAPSFGGPLLGLFACTESMVRHMPGRVVGETVDRQGRAGYCLTLQAREQHIRREKATSNICTSETLCAVAASAYLAALGPVGLREVAELSAQKAHFLSDRLGECDAAAHRRFAGPFVNEFVVHVPEPADGVVGRLVDRGYLVGPALGRDYPELSNCLLLAVTEQRTRAEIEGLLEALNA
jgi:glycine dehydrogenase subunit 1